MTPAARAAAAIEVLDALLAGTPAEQGLLRWARGARYAGSKDRAAVRDLVFEAWRKRRSCGWLGGGETGRGLILGLTRLEGRDPSEIFGAGGYGPPGLGAEEAEVRPLGAAPDPVRLDCPDWLWPQMQESLGAACAETLEILRHRAPVGLRVNPRKSTRAAAISALEAAGFAPKMHPLSPMALTVEAARGLERHALYLEGAIEFQDPGAQALVADLPLVAGARLLDFCAGGGGKSLAIAAQHEGEIVAHDASAQRLRDLEPRAARAGADIVLSLGDPGGDFDGILLDVPCSGTGAWRRQVDAKWRLTPERLQELREIQAEILAQSFARCRPGGWIAYMTCSVLACENQRPVAEALAKRDDFVIENQRVIAPSLTCDGFFVALLRAKS